MPSSRHRLRPALHTATALLIAGVGLVGGCTPDDDRRGDPDLQVAVSVEPDPPGVGTAGVEVRLAEVDWSPRNGDRVIVQARRDSILLAQDTAFGQGAGIYRADSVPFPVAGDWTLTVRVETRDGRWLEVDRPLEVRAEGS